MARIEITVPGERIVEEFTALVSQPTTPTGARPPDIGTVQISQSTPTQLIPGPPGPQGPRGSRWFTGTGNPTIVPGLIIGDQYLESVTGIVWSFDGAVWTSTGTDLTGPQGSPDTAAQVLAKLVTVDGIGSGLDADLLDGQSGTYYSAWGNLTGKPATFPPSAHVHPESEITNLVADLAAKAPLASPALTGAPTAPTAAPGTNSTQIASTAFVGAAITADVTPWAEITGKPATFPPTLPINESDVTNLVTDLAAKAPLASPVFTGDPRAPTPAPTDNDTSLATTAFVKNAVAATGVVATAERRNRIVNPAMQISQENGDAAGVNVNGYFAADQWQGYYLAAGLSSAFYRRAPALTPNGSLARLRLNVNTPKGALATGDYYEIYQPLEGVQVADFKWGTAAARQVVLRFGFAGPAGTYCIGLRNTALNRCYFKKFTIAANNVDTEVVIVIPGDVTGAWTTVEDAGIYFHIGLAAGTAQQAPAEGWQAGTFVGVVGMSNGIGAIASFEIFDVGLHLDPLNTGLPPVWETPNVADELVRCQRYWQQTSLMWYGSTVNAVVYSAQGYLSQVPRAGSAFSGVNIVASGFPTTVGGIIPYAGTFTALAESRTCNATLTFGRWITGPITANGRM